MTDEPRSAGGASPGSDGDGGGADRFPTLAELAVFLQLASRLPPRKLRRLLAAVRDAARRLDS